jgi:hypothetical protein
MKLHFDGLSPDDPSDPKNRLQEVINFWNGFGCRQDAGETTWGILEEIQIQVTECLRQQSPDLEEAERLTAKAALLLTGRIVF